jgi:hypothetical protein
MSTKSCHFCLIISGATAVLIPVANKKVFSSDGDYSKLIADILQFKVPVILVKDLQELEGFPSQEELAPCLATSGLLSLKTVDYEVSKAKPCWDNIFAAVTAAYASPQEKFKTDIVLTHRQATGHYFAGLLYYTLRDIGQKVYLDIEAETDVAALQEILNNTNLILIVVTSSYFTSNLCHEVKI